MKKIILRPVNLRDSEIIFQWRNHEKIRKHSLNMNPIDFKEHTAWFENSLKNKNRVILMAEFNDERMGVFRLDILPDSNEISIYLNPEWIGKGQGENLLESGIHWIKNNLPHIKKLDAKILPENMASIRIFEKQNFVQKYVYYERIL